MRQNDFDYLMKNVDESSTESDILVLGIIDWKESPHHLNKKAYKLTLVKDGDGSNLYRSRIGFNFFKLP